MSGPEHFAGVGWHLVKELRPKWIAMKSTTADRIRDTGKNADYETAALEALAKAYEDEEHENARFHVAEAQVWATLHLARVSS